MHNHCMTERYTLNFICLPAVDCGSLLPPKNGVVAMHTTVFNSTVTYSCNIGYELDGNQSRTCLASGNWSDNQPICAGE